MDSEDKFYTVVAVLIAIGFAVFCGVLLQACEIDSIEDSKRHVLENECMQACFDDEQSALECREACKPRGRR